ncbi:aldehyde dehydrogenase (NADP(+)) [Mucilaginibacter polytrichastri]|uniref:NADP-dependent fatty aldehyde dehydrogenase n=1 Tax=Mucilaginibacter polytrichastri TaxID=1302689 RepID=A0A1Q5ZX99_9SPHI|nr:aldehyde dehydrogenase (NADP(+)) [Mucilaginibacter polytrichastri]OKS86377.1 NADP-dependent fatty aldehyde dehydrogenase [Mucilaginibacter polytrichastri]SFT20834.1 NADP-dependent aldehyde dehydrogenase [Mucilaginibacter polytrichastri]
MTAGEHIIGFELSAEGSDIITSINPATGDKVGDFFVAIITEVDKAAEKAAAAFQIYRKKSGTEKAGFLEAIAEEIMAIGDELISVCCAESALPKGRIEGERGRTIGQLKLFANLLKEGSWLDARIETADPERVPLPKPDIRFMQIPLGPVAVFGASNFPLAFSVAGGDTVSALAAGCSVIVKAHPAHPATSWLIGNAIQKAAITMEMPDGIFSLLFGDGPVLGTQLVKHPAIKAVGFTGSFGAGKAIYDIAVRRDIPIPVYAEMGSTNPVFILPQALQNQADLFVKGFSGSVTLGVGQFCTNPGMLIYENTDDSEIFTNKLEEEFKQTSGGVMLAANIYKSYNAGVARHADTAGVTTLAKGKYSENLNTAAPVLFKIKSDTLKAHPNLAEEVFGPTSMLVEATSRQDVLEIARNLTGHLTATVHGTDSDLLEYKDLLNILEQKVGRLLINGYPTGVEVCSAMVHGGPFPATSDSRSTSVGTAAIDRFTRPVCYQDMPQALLPDELKNTNPLGIWRLINGSLSNEAINYKPTIL